MKWTPTHNQMLLWLAYQEVKTRNADSKKISEAWPEINGETPSPRAVSERLTSIKKGVGELGLAEFFGNSGLGVPRGKLTSSRSNSSNVKEMMRAKQPFHRRREIPLSSPSTKLRIEDVRSAGPEIGTPPPSTGDGEDGGVVVDSDIDGETVTDSDADASVVPVPSQSVRKQPNKNTKHSNPEPGAAATIPRGSQPARNRVDEARLTGSRASRFERGSGTVGKDPPPSMKLRSLPKRTYEASIDLSFEDEDSEPAARERERKKPHHNYESLPPDALLDSARARS